MLTFLLQSAIFIENKLPSVVGITANALTFRAADVSTIRSMQNDLSTTKANLKLGY